MLEWWYALSDEGRQLVALVVGTFGGALAFGLVSLIARSITYTWANTSKKERAIRIVDEKLFLDEFGCYCFDVTMRNVGKETAIITKARIEVVEFYQLDVFVNAISKLVSTADYNVRISPDDDNLVYEVDMSQQVDPYSADKLRIRIDSADNSWVCVFKVVFEINEQSREIPSKRIGVYFEDVFDGWKLSEEHINQIPKALARCELTSESVRGLLNRIDSLSATDDDFGGNVYIPPATLVAMKRSGHDPYSTPSPSEATIHLLDESGKRHKIGCCGFVRENWAQTVAHVLHNRRTGEIIEPSRIFVMPNGGKKRGDYLPAVEYVLPPSAKDGLPCEGIVFIRLAESSGVTEFAKTPIAFIDDSMDEKSKANECRLAADAAWSAGELSTCIHYLEQAISHDSHFGLFVSKAVCLDRMGESIEAIKAVNKAIAMAPRIAINFNYRGDFHLKLDELEKAIQDYSTAIELDPAFSMAFCSRAKSHTKLKDYFEAVKDLNAAIELDPDNPDIFLSRAEVFRLIGDFNAAVADYKEFLRLRPDAHSRDRIRIQIKRLTRITTQQCEKRSQSHR